MNNNDRLLYDKYINKMETNNPAVLRKNIQDYIVLLSRNPNLKRQLIRELNRKRGRPGIVSYLSSFFKNPKQVVVNYNKFKVEKPTTQELENQLQGIKDQAKGVVDETKITLVTNKNLNNVKNIEDSYLRKILIRYNAILSIKEPNSKHIVKAGELLHEMKSNLKIIRNTLHQQKQYPQLDYVIYHKYKKYLNAHNKTSIPGMLYGGQSIKSEKNLTNNLKYNQERFNTYKKLFNEYIEKIKPQIENYILNRQKLGIFLKSNSVNDIVSDYMFKANRKYKNIINLINARRRVLR